MIKSVNVVFNVVVGDLILRTIVWMRKSNNGNESKMLLGWSVVEMVNKVIDFINWDFLIKGCLFSRFVLEFFGKLRG